MEATWIADSCRLWRSPALVALAPAMTAHADPYGDAATAASAALVARHGEAERARIARGVAQVQRAWRADDGDPAAFRAFVEAEFLPQGPALDAAFARLESAFERVDGYFNALGRRPAPRPRPGDRARAADRRAARRLGSRRATSPTTCSRRGSRSSSCSTSRAPPWPSGCATASSGAGGSGRRPGSTGRFALRVPAAAQAKLADARAAAEAYINGYNLRAHHLLARDGRRLFRPKLRLISHWNLRDELKGAYADADGLDRQRVIAAAMDAIVRQTIPAAVIDNPALDWTPETGAVAVSPVKDDAPLPGAATTASADARGRRPLRAVEGRCSTPSARSTASRPTSPPSSTASSRSSARSRRPRSSSCCAPCSRPPSARVSRR